MSEIKVNKITPRVACGTTQLGDSGDTITIPSGATITNAGTASGFGATGETSWDTTVKTTGTFTATAGVGYFLNTTGGTITVNLPVGAAGSSVALADYAGTWQTNNVTVSPNGSEFIGGVNADVTLSTEGQSVTFVYIDGTQGWVNVIDSTSNVRGNNFVIATGGTPCTGAICGDYKTHTFTGPGTLIVSATGTPTGSDSVDYLVVAGGGGGGAPFSGGGAGGFRLSNNTCMPGPATSPLASVTGVPVTATPYAIVVGGGGPAGSTPPATPGGNGNVSSFSTISSAGGGGGKTTNGVGIDGGSGSGGVGSPAPAPQPGFAGGVSSPVTSPIQGNAGGKGGDGLVWMSAGGGGGGAGACGQDSLAPGGANSPGYAGSGGIGSYVVQTGFAGCNGTPGPVPGARYFAGGGGGGVNSSTPGAGGDGGAGGGGQGFASPTNPAGGMTATAGGCNTGGGGGSPAAGGSGIVVIRYKFQ